MLLVDTIDPDTLNKDGDLVLRFNDLPFIWSNKWFRSCNRNSYLFRDLILLEVEEMNGIVWFIVGSICK
jgi:hypothetical protein